MERCEVPARTNKKSYGSSFGYSDTLKLGILDHRLPHSSVLIVTSGFKRKALTSFQDEMSSNCSRKNIYADIEFTTGCIYYG